MLGDNHTATFVCLSPFYAVGVAILLCYIATCLELGVKIVSSARDSSKCLDALSISLEHLGIVKSPVGRVSESQKRRSRLSIGRHTPS